jgi:hypothetical protein
MLSISFNTAHCALVSVYLFEAYLFHFDIQIKVFQAKISVTGLLSKCFSQACVLHAPKCFDVSYIVPSSNITLSHRDTSYKILSESDLS